MSRKLSQIRESASIFPDFQVNTPMPWQARPTDVRQILTEGEIAEALQGTTPLLTQLPPYGTRVMKTAKRTQAAWGTLHAIKMTLPVFTSEPARIVRLDDLVEIELDEGGTVLPGDSGALLCVKDTGQMKAFAVLVASSTENNLAGSAPRLLIYGVPISALLPTA